MKAGVSVVVPVFNGAENLKELVQRLDVVLSERDGPFEIVLVNDGSRDDSWSEILRIAAEDPRVRGVDLMRNFGQHNALLAGIRLARHPITVTLDDDLQQPPEEIPGLLGKLEAGHDLVYGVPHMVHQPTARRLGSGALRWVLGRLLDLDGASDLSPFRAFRTELREAFADYSGSFVTLDALLSWGARSSSRVVVDHVARRRGQSNYSLGMLLRQAFHTVTTFSVRPLQFASVLGFAFTAVGFAGMAYTLGFYRLRGLPIPSDVFIFAVVCMFSGLQLFTLGILGAYLGRMHLRLLDRPAYVVRDDTEGRS